MTDTQSVNFDNEDELKQRSLKLLSDQAINWSMIVLMGGLRLTALANMVLKRTLEEEQEASDIYDYMVASARDKARQQTDLDELLRVMKEFVPPFLEEEISRLKSAQSTERLMSSKRRKSYDTTIGVHGLENEFKEKQALLLLGSADKVANAIDELLGVPSAWKYTEDQQPVERTEIAYLNHRLSEDFGCRHVPLQDWQGATNDARSWNTFATRLLQSGMRRMVISNLIVAGKWPPPARKSLASVVKNSISTLSRWLVLRDCTVVAGVYYPQQHDPSFEEELSAYVGKRSNIILWKLD